MRKTDLHLERTPHQKTSDSLGDLRIDARA